MPTTQVDFETGEGPKPIGWCPDPMFDEAGNLVGLANATPASADMDGTADDGKGIQYACVGKQSPAIESVVGGTDNLEVTEQIYLLGDVLMRK